MPSPDQNHRKNLPESPEFPPLTLLVSLTTVPLLLGLVSTKALAASIRELGEFSEELFRGDRLPPLPFPVATINSPKRSDLV